MSLSEAYNRSTQFIKERWTSVVGITTLNLILMLILGALFTYLAFRDVSSLGLETSNAFEMGDLSGGFHHSSQMAHKLFWWSLLFLVVYSILSSVIIYPLLIVMTNHVHGKKSKSVLSYFSMDTTVQAIKYLVAQVLIAATLAIIFIILAILLAMIVYALGGNVAPMKQGFVSGGWSIEMILILIIIGYFFGVTLTTSLYKLIDLFVYHRQPFFTSVIESLKFGLPSPFNWRIGGSLLVILIFMVVLSLIIGFVIGLIIPQPKETVLRTLLYGDVESLKMSIGLMVVRNVLNTYISALLSYWLFQYPVLYLIVHDWSKSEGWSGSEEERKEETIEKKKRRGRRKKSAKEEEEW